MAKYVFTFPANVLAFFWRRGKYKILVDSAELNS